MRRNGVEWSASKTEIEIGIRMVRGFCFCFCFVSALWILCKGRVIQDEEKESSFLAFFPA